MEEDKTSVETEMEVDEDEEAEASFPSPIAVLDNKFHLIQKIGEGSTSSVIVHRINLILFIHSKSSIRTKMIRRSSSEKLKCLVRSTIQM